MSTEERKVLTMKELSHFSQMLHQIAEFVQGLRWFTRIVAIYALVQGFTIVFADTPRFQASAYEYFRAVPGSPDIWGIIMVIAGLVMWVGVSIRHDRVTGVGVAMASLWSAILSFSFLKAAAENPDANLTGIVVYGKDAVSYLILAIILFHYGRFRKEME